ILKNNLNIRLLGNSMEEFMAGSGIGNVLLLGPGELVDNVAEEGGHKGGDYENELVPKRECGCDESRNASSVLEVVVGFPLREFMLHDGDRFGNGLGNEGNEAAIENSDSRGEGNKSGCLQSEI